MSDRLIQQLQKAKQQAKLSGERKAAIRTHLLHTIDGRVRASQALRGRAVPTPASFAFFSTQNRLRAITAVVAVLAMSGAGVSLAAEKALPGDALYTIKVDVNENLRRAVALSTQSKAQVAVTLAERRLEEASSLSAEGRLDPETEATLRTHFEEESERAETHIAALNAHGDVQVADDLAGRFEGTLRAQQVVLDAFEGTDDGEIASEKEEDNSGAPAAAALTLTGSTTVKMQNDDGKEGRRDSIGTSVRGRINALHELRAQFGSRIDEKNSDKNTTDDDADNKDDGDTTTNDGQRNDSRGKNNIERGVLNASGL